MPSVILPCRRQKGPRGKGKGPGTTKHMGLFQTGGRFFPYFQVSSMGCSIGIDWVEFENSWPVSVMRLLEGVPPPPIPSTRRKSPGDQDTAVIETNLVSGAKSFSSNLPLSKSMRRKLAGLKYQPYLPKRAGLASATRPWRLFSESPSGATV